MNDLIKQLAEQAEKYADDNFKGEPTYSEAYDLKFAELIIRECISKVEPTEHHRAYPACYLGDYEGLELLEHVVVEIKKHFGVKDDRI